MCIVVESCIPSSWEVELSNPRARWKQDKPVMMISEFCGGPTSMNNLKNDQHHNVNLSPIHTHVSLHTCTPYTHIHENKTLPVNQETILN